MSEPNNALTLSPWARLADRVFPGLPPWAAAGLMALAGASAALAALLHLHPLAVFAAAVLAGFGAGTFVLTQAAALASASWPRRRHPHAHP